VIVLTHVHGFPIALIGRSMMAWARAQREDENPRSDERPLKAERGS